MKKGIVFIALGVLVSSIPTSTAKAEDRGIWQPKLGKYCKLVPDTVRWTLSIGEAAYTPVEAPSPGFRATDTWGCSSSMVGKSKDSDGNPTEGVWVMCKQHNTEAHMSTRVECKTQAPDYEHTMFILEDSFQQDSKTGAIVVLQCLEVPNMVCSP